MLRRDRGTSGKFALGGSVLARCGKVFACVLAAGLLFIGGQAARADDGLETRKFDPYTGEASPIAANLLRAGNIYSHFDESLGRRVWSRFLGSGKFGIALGQGTTQHARLLDINLPPREALEILRKWDPKLAEDTVRDGTDVYLKLSPDQHWRVTRTTVAMIYDAQTGYRFEQQFGHYIPVYHYGGYAWRPDGTRFAPAP